MNRSPAPGRSAALPVIDLGGLGPAIPRASAVAAALDAAFRRIGFCYIVDTGVDPALVEAMFDSSRRFHALPAEAKPGYRMKENRPAP